MIQYIQDNDETLPFGHSSQGGSGVPLARNLWMNQISPYIKSEQVYNCPNSSNARKFAFEDYARPGSYAINMAGFFDGPTTIRCPASSTYGGFGSAGFYTTKLSLLEAPASTVWIGDNSIGLTRPDGSSTDDQSETWYLYSQYASTPPSVFTAIGMDAVGYIDPAATPGVFTSNYTWAARHLNTINVLWCDGHVKAMRAADLAKTNGSGVANLFTIQDD